MKTFNQCITELFDKPEPFSYRRSHNGGYYYDADINGNHLVLFADNEKSVWYIDFEVNDNMEVTDSGGNEVAIFSTVIAMLKHFVETASPETVKFTADKTEKSRISLYDKMVKKFAAESGYSHKRTISMRSGKYSVYVLKKK